MSLLERLFFFHQEIQNNKYPNSRDISEQFEVSLPTAKRDIAYLRDRLLAPLCFSQQENGYYYENTDFHLPFEESPRIIFLLAVLGKLAGEAGLGNLEEVRQLEKRLAGMVTGDYGKIVDALQVQWIEVEQIGKKIFETVIEALVRNKQLKLQYKSLSGTISDRAIAPFRIINYQGRWYLFGYCYLRKADRLFHLGRFLTVELSEEQIGATTTFNESNLEHSFGIFQGKPKYTAEILFTSTAAELVRHQHWHGSQNTTEVDDGIIMQLPVGDDREILMKILQYGKMAKVLGPPELVTRIEKEISAMSRNYR